MPSLISEVFLEAEGSLPAKSARKTPLSRKVRNFYCNSSDLAKVKRLVPTASGPALRSAIETAVARALPWIYKAIGNLRVSPRSATTISIFRRAFAQNPDWNPAWKTSKMKWIDWGDLVATRLERAAHILNGGEIKYFCYGSPAHCSECTDSPPSYIACSSFKGRYTICMGDDFWKDWQSGNWDSLASNLLHEALHIYFGRTVEHTGRSGNASCYQRFVSDINGKPLLSRLASRCPATP